MDNNNFLIDSNSFIDPSQRSYRFNCFPSFWQWLKKEIQKDDNRIIIPKCVFDELKNNNDELTDWVDENLNEYYFDERTEPIVWQNYAKVIDYINNSGIYGGAGARDWSREGKADPILIAIAMSYDYKIVTSEKFTGEFVSLKDEDGKATNKLKNPNYSTNKEPKIPDVAQHFGVSCISLYDVEEILGLAV